MVFVQVFGEPPIVRVFSPVLGDVGQSKDLPSAINNLNTQFEFIKWCLNGGVIVASMDLFGSPLIDQHVLDACGVVGDTANNLDDQLQEAFGGRTFFGEDVGPKPPHGAGGYL